VLFLSVAQEPNSGQGPLIGEVPRSNIDTQIPGRTSLKRWLARHKGRYLDDTQRTQQTNIHTLNKIRTRDPNNQAVSGLHLRLQTIGTGWYLNGFKS
jgi:hypothetical protein